MISIILPVYNVNLYIEKCIDSIINQSFQNFELIVIDDCGTDDSIQLVEKRLSNSSINFQIIYNEHNKGLSESRNVGLAHSKSEYILFIDSDDWLSPLMLERLYSSAIENDADLVSCRAMEFWEKTGKLSKMHKIKQGVYTPTNYLSLLFNGDTSAHIWIRLIKRELLRDIKFPKNVIFEDVLTVPYIIKSARKIVQLDDELYFYLQRNSKTSITGKKPTNITGFLSCLKKLQEDFEPTSASNGLGFRRFLYKILFIVVYNTIHYSPTYSEAKKDLKDLKSFIKINILLRDIITLSKSIGINSLLYLCLLKTNKMLLYFNHKKVLNR